MNKRQRKKAQKNQESFVLSWVNSYKELKKISRSYHEYVVAEKRRDRNWLKEAEDALMSGLEKSYEFN